MWKKEYTWEGIRTMSEEMDKLCVECAEHVLEVWQEDFEAWYEKAPDWAPCKLGYFECKCALAARRHSTEGLGGTPICIEQLRRIATGKWCIKREEKKGNALVMLPGFDGWDRARVQNRFEFRDAFNNMRE